MPVLSGVCSFYDNDDFVHVSIGDEFADGSWSTVESILLDLIFQLAQLRSQAILLNLSGVSATNSAVVTATIRIWKSIVGRGGRIVVLAPSNETRRTLTLAGLSRRLEIAQAPDDALHRLGLSRVARLTRRETTLLKWISPIAAAGAVVSLVAILLSLSPTAFQPSIVFMMITSAIIASGGGWLAAAREFGAFRHVSRLVAATGVITLITGLGQWPM